MTQALTVEGKFGTVSPFRKPAQPLKLGELRSRTWRAPFWDERVEAVWLERSAEYWKRQSLLFGVVFSRHKVTFDPMTETVTTFAVLMAYVPGERIEGYVLPDRSN